MSMKIGTQLDTMQIPIKDMVLPQGTAFPTTPAPVKGQKFYRTDLDAEYVCTNATGPVWTRTDNNGVAGVPDASETVKGIVELATTAEAAAGSDTVRAVTPAGAASAIAVLAPAAIPSASETVQGKVELATNAETTTGTDTTRATTPANVKAAIDARVVAATELVSGIVELATTAETTTGTDTTRAVTPAGVAAAINALVAGAPGLLNTLDELAAALGDDPNFATTITNSLANKQPLDATLTALAGVTVAADKLIYATGADTFTTTDLTATGRSLIGQASMVAARVALGAPGRVSAALPALVAGAWSASQNHGLNSLLAHAEIVDTTTQEKVVIDWKIIDANNIQYRSDIAFAASALTAIVHA
jgi:hypothetical protein